MTNWWISWYHHQGDGPFEYHGPWWISGYAFDPDRDIIVAAVQAEDEDAVWELVRNTYDTPPDSIEQRFCDAMPEDIEPFNSRFQRAEWMKWPVTV